ncbi:23S rRNA (pseudouridine(1915)-N(3))-methyltransferase RlmH [Candidatus Uhrbacteria bacterium]|nr:23S rRNA (pseudouridine(1915)-N(3))-methyltransferase RlmH [Candidatus Uhrbacteria bacterium]
MLSLTIRAIGKLPEDWMRQGVDMYVDRLKPLAKIGLIELPEGHKGASKPDVNKTKKTEGESLLKGLPPDALVVALDETGRSLSTQEFTAKLDEWSPDGSRALFFLIGGSWGLDKDVLKRADAVISLGKMTLPHGLARLVLLEQLYRANMIKAGRTYHK